jgi:hypothetical protein
MGFEKQKSQGKNTDINPKSPHHYGGRQYVFGKEVLHPLRERKGNGYQKQIHQENGPLRQKPFGIAPKQTLEQSQKLSSHL